MKETDLGYHPKTKKHNSTLTFAEEQFVGFLWEDHVGSQNKISADLLAVMFARVMNAGDITFKDEPLRRWKRHVRTMQNHLLTCHEHLPILSKAGNDGGYWIAEHDFEAEEFYHSFRKRGMTGLVKASRGKKATMVEIMQQLSFEFDELVDKAGVTAARKNSITPPVPVSVVDQFLGKMLENPEKYADGLKKISQKYGGVLMPKKQVSEMKEMADKLHKMMVLLSA